MSDRGDKQREMLDFATQDMKTMEGVPASPFEPSLFIFRVLISMV